MDLTDFLASERVFELNVKNPAFAKQNIISNAKGFLWRTTLRPTTVGAI